MSLIMFEHYKLNAWQLHERAYTVLNCRPAHFKRFSTKCITMQYFQLVMLKSRVSLLYLLHSCVVDGSVTVRFLFKSGMSFGVNGSSRLSNNNDNHDNNNSRLNNKMEELSHFYLLSSLTMFCIRILPERQLQQHRDTTSSFHLSWSFISAPPWIAPTSGNLTVVCPSVMLCIMVLRVCVEVDSYTGAFLRRHLLLTSLYPCCMT